MATIVELLGRTFTEPEVAKRLTEYRGLKLEEGDASPDARIAPVKYLRSAAEGLLIKLSDEGVILAIFMMSGGKEDYSEFRGELPGKINFAAEPEDAIRALGPPASRRAAATYGGIALGEMLFRASSMVLDNTATGSGRTWKELGGALLSPVRGFTRLVTGEWSEVGPNPADRMPSRLGGRFLAGARFVGDRTLDQTEGQGFLELGMIY